MAAGKGRDFLLKIGDGASPTTFNTVGGMRTTAMQLNNNPVDVTTKDSGGIQDLLVDAGVQSFSVSADGVFSDAAQDETLRAAAFAKMLTEFQLVFANADTYTFWGLVDSYQRGGGHDGIETFSVSITRDGTPNNGTYTAA